MPVNSGAGRQKANTHSDAYWDRLRSEFQNCEYGHSGAYNEIHDHRSAEIVDLERRIDENEAILNSPLYQHMKTMGEFRTRASDRLLAARSWKAKTA
jgi:hypothetical protein